MTRTLQLCLLVADYLAAGLPGARYQDGLELGCALVSLDGSLLAPGTLVVEGHTPAHEIRRPAAGKRFTTVPTSAAVTYGQIADASDGAQQADRGWENGPAFRQLVEALVDRLVALLDAEDAASYDMEPDADFEESDEGETETWSEWHPRECGF